jgi:tetratricopeptide (TPR) repeat protein
MENRVYSRKIFKGAHMRRNFRVFTASALMAAILPISSLAQDLVPVSDISGGSSVFVFRNSAKAAPPKFTTRASRRSKEERIESAKKINRQYETLAKAAPRRAREKAVDPNNLPDAIRIKSMPKDEASRLFAGVGEYYIDKNDSENAINFFREAITLDANNAIAPKGLSEALALKGNELLVKDQVKAAKGLFDEALQHNPNNAVAYYGLAEVYSDQEMDAESIRNYEAALRYDKDLTEIYVPLGILYYQAGNIDKADQLLTKAVAAEPNSAETEFFFGLVRYAQNKTAEALAAFNKATAAKPTYAEAFYYTGEALDRMAETATGAERKNLLMRAAEAYQKALELKPNYFEAAYDLGSEYFKLEDWGKAITYFDTARKLKNTDIQTYINLGDAYRLSGDFEKAESSYNNAVTFMERASNPDKTELADTYNKIGFVIAQQCPKNTARALPCRWNMATTNLEKAASLTHDNVDYANLGWAYYNAARKDFADHKFGDDKDVTGREKLEKARANLQKATAIDSKYFNAPMVNLGMALNDLGEYKSAIDVLSKVVQREPKWVFAINELGVAYLLNKDYKNAIARFNEVLKKDDKYASAWFNLGKAQFQNGNIGEARKAYSQLRKIGANALADRLDRETGGAMARG